MADGEIGKSSFERINAIRKSTARTGGLFILMQKSRYTIPSTEYTSIDVVESKDDAN